MTHAAGREQLSVSTVIPSERISRLSEFTEEPVSRHIEVFAQDLVTPLRRMVEAGVPYIQDPENFNLNARLRLNAIRQGLTHYDADVAPQSPQHPIQEQLQNLSGDEVAELYLAVPEIAKIGFPADFAAEVERQWQETLRYWGYVEDLPDKVLNEIPPIETKITSPVHAKELIVDSARQVILDLDWQWAAGDPDVTPQQAAQIFDVVCPKLLKDLTDSSGAAATDDVRANMTIVWDDEVKDIDESLLILLLSPMPPKDATFIRDYLCVSSLEEIVAWLNLDYCTDGKLLTANPGLAQAFRRMVAYTS